METLSKYLIGAVAVLTAVVIWFIINTGSLNRSNKTWEHNYRVLKDSVSVINTKYGEALYENNSLILSKKELEDALGISKKQVRDYEKTLGSKLAYISKLESKLNIKDTIVVTDIKHDTIVKPGWYSGHFENQWLSFNHIFDSEIPKLEVFDINFNVPLKVGLTDDYQIFVTSPNPYFKVSDIEGVVIDKSRFAQRQRRFVITAYAGFGGQWGLIQKKFDVGPQVGVGVGIRIW